MAGVNPEADQSVLLAVRSEAARLIAVVVTRTRYLFATAAAAQTTRALNRKLDHAASQGIEPSFGRARTDAPCIFTGATFQRSILSGNIACCRIGRRAA
jgi:hypothetical protein